MRKKVIGLLVGASAIAHAGQPAHEHGVAELRLALDGGSLLIEFGTPLDNLVGFEHAPRTAGQRKALLEAEAKLGDPAALFRVPQDAACVVRELEVVTPYPAADPHAGKREHPHRHGHRDGEGHEHADVHAAYHFECARPEALEAVELDLVRVFPRIRSLRVQSATPRGQNSLRLDPGLTHVTLRVPL